MEEVPVIGVSGASSRLPICVKLSTPAPRFASTFNTKLSILFTTCVQKVSRLPYYLFELDEYALLFSREIYLILFVTLNYKKNAQLNQRGLYLKISSKLTFLFFLLQSSKGSSICFYVAPWAEVVPPKVHYTKCAAAERHRLPLHKPRTRGWSSEPVTTRKFDDDEARRVGALRSLVAAQHIFADVAFCKASDLFHRSYRE